MVQPNLPIRIPMRMAEIKKMINGLSFWMIEIEILNGFEIVNQYKIRIGNVAGKMISSQAHRTRWIESLED